MPKSAQVGNREGEGSRELNTLSATNKYKLAVWCDTKRDWINKERLGFAATAAKAAEDLKFPVTAANVKLAYKAIGFVPTFRQNGEGAKRTSAAFKRLEVAETKIDALEARLAVLEESLGVKRPA